MTGECRNKGGKGGVNINMYETFWSTDPLGRRGNFLKVFLVQKKKKAMESEKHGDSLP